MTYEECKKTIAVKYQLGTTLVTGHRASYFEEAAILYASQQAKEQWNAAIDAALCSGDHFGLGEDIYLDKNTVEKLKKS